MHKIITSDFEIDLNGYNISIQEENSWFSDTFFTKYSYPFDLIITDQINLALGDILSFDSKSGKYYIECQYVYFNKIESALLIIEQINEKVASVSIKYGMDGFPNFEKNLNELELYKADVFNIYWEAEQNIYKTYPQTNFNFPQVHTDKYDGNSTEYFGFQNILNNRKNGAFLTNTVEIENNEDIMYNRNIMQPMSYLMYVLNKGFQLSGLTLTGDIINDELLKKILIYKETEPFEKKELEALNISYNYDEVDGSTPTYEVPEYWTAWPIKQYIVKKTITVTTPGKYKIIGQVDTRTNNYNYGAYFRIAKDNQTLLTKTTKFAPWSSYVETDFFHKSGTCEILVEAMTAVQDYQTVFDLQILPIYFINSAGEKETNLINQDVIDLNKVVPNITFGSLVNAVLNLFNYDVDSVTNTEVVINRIDNSMKTNEIIDLSRFDNINVVRKINSDVSYLFKYDEEGEIDLGGFYIDKKESYYVTKDFIKQVQNTISIPIYPLQNELRNDVFTAKTTQPGDDKICFVLYDGLINGNNLTIDPIDLSIPSVVSEYHYSWLKNRVESIEYNMSFIASIYDVLNLNTKKRAFCYSNLHLIKSLVKSQLHNDLVEVELETESLVEL